MEDSILDAEFKMMRGDAAVRAATVTEIERKATLLLQLPLSALPEPSRTDIFALQLRTRSDLGRCDEVSADIPRLERIAARVYPRHRDSEAPPTARTLVEVRALQSRLSEDRAFHDRLKAARSDGSVVRWPELQDVASGDRLGTAREILAGVEEEFREEEGLLRGREDSEVAAEWSRRDLARWEKSHGVASPQLGSYDASSQSERLSIQVRAAQGRCLLARQRMAEAVRVLEPCVGGAAISTRSARKR